MDSNIQDTSPQEDKDKPTAFSTSRGDFGAEQLGNVTTVNIHRKAGLGTIQQTHAIPATAQRKVTTKWEYATFCIFYFSMNGAPIGNSGYSLAQALLSQQFPDGMVTWGGRTLTSNAMLLDVSGILFAIQLVILLTIGPYADYGNWRPWIMILFQTLLYITQLAMCGISRADEWQVALALYGIGSVATNIVTAFYSAEFPAIVHDLPKMIESEQEVHAGMKSPEEHGEMESYERSKLFNMVNFVGSIIVVVAYAIAVGISARVGYDTDAKLIHSYVVLMGYFSALTLLCTLPFFLAQKHRPGQQLPTGTSWWTVGPKQVWSAAKDARRLKNCLIYLFANFMVQESFNTYFNVTAILQNEVVNYSPLLNNALTIVSDLAGGLGTFFFIILQKKYHFSVKSAVIYGAFMCLVPNLWGAIGMFTNAIGFHHVWEFWLQAAWNFQTAAWGSYQVTMVTEVVPAPKAYMFFALFNTVSKTSGFIGPLISSAIIDRAGGNTSASFWFLLGMGVVGTFTLFFVDPDEAKVDNARYLEREAAEYYSEGQITAARALEMTKPNQKQVPTGTSA